MHGEALAVLRGHTAGVRHLAFGAVATLLASPSEDGTVRLWDPASGQLLQTMQGHAGMVWSVAISGDGRLLASGGEDGTVHLWESATGATRYILRPDRLYERLDFTGVTGVTEAQWAALLALGAAGVRDTYTHLHQLNLWSAGLRRS
jgi:WD40 repeat protein